MKYTGKVYRPPFDSKALLLQATVGCSHNKCSFCSMYQDVPFQIESLEQIESDLREAASYSFKRNKIFLVNADAFVLSFDYLKKIGEKIDVFYPSCKTISLFATINNIKAKTDIELRELRALKYNDFNIGIESGFDNLVRDFNKGHTVDEAKTQLLRLKKAGIDYSVNVIIGAGGTRESKKHIEKTVEFINLTKPKLVFIANMNVEENTPLFKKRASGDFIENTTRMNIQETADLIAGINVETIFYGLHPSNMISTYGILPKDKSKMLAKINSTKSRLSSEILDSIPSKGDEGRILLNNY